MPRPQVSASETTNNTNNLLQPPQQQQRHRIPMTRSRVAALKAALNGNDPSDYYNPINHNIHNSNNADAGKKKNTNGKVSASTTGSNKNYTILNSETTKTSNANANGEADDSYLQLLLSTSPSNNNFNHNINETSLNNNNNNNNSSKRPQNSITKNKAPVFRCVCHKKQLLSSSSVVESSLDLIQCLKCHHVLHCACVGITRPEKLSSRTERDAAVLSVETFICQFCLKENNGTVGGVRLVHHSATPNGNTANSSWRHNKTQAQLNAACVEDQELMLSPEEEMKKILSVKETPDHTILNQEPFHRIIKNATEFLEKSGFKLLLFPDSHNDSSINNSNMKKMTTSSPTNNNNKSNSISAAIAASPMMMMNLTFSEMEDQVMECSRSSIEDATFSEEYPLYCVRELQSRKHPYLQGAAAWCNQTKRIASIVMSNGRDPYCDLQPTIQNLKKQVSRGKVKILSTPQEEAKYAKDFAAGSSSDKNNNNSNSAPKTTLNMSSSIPSGVSRIRQRQNNDISENDEQNKKNLSSSAAAAAAIRFVTTDPISNVILFRGQAATFAKKCMNEFREFDAVVHFTYIVTHEKYRGKSLAKALMWIELARWALRGRTNACVNMALEKIYHEQQCDGEKRFVADDDDDEDENGEKEEVSISSALQEDASVLTNSSDLLLHQHHQRRTMSSIVSSPQSSNINNNDSTKTALPKAGKNTKNNNNNKKKKTAKNERAIDDDDDGNDDAPKTILECRATEASRRLYNGLTFQEVFPRYNSDGSFRWSRKEENSGRMMLSTDFPSAIYSMWSAKLNSSNNNNATVTGNCPFL